MIGETLKQKADRKTRQRNRRIAQYKTMVDKAAKQVNLARIYLEDGALGTAGAILSEAGDILERAQILKHLSMTE